MKRVCISSAEQSNEALDIKIQQSPRQVLLFA